MLLPIEIGRDNPILRRKSKKVAKFDKALKKLLKDMEETMLKKDGVGLAAPQIGLNQRIIVENFQFDAKKTRVIFLVNPEIIDASIACEASEEGCLSLPNEYGVVNRHSSITVKFHDEKGNLRVLELSGFNARIAQHEIDHLDGILFVDRVEGEIRKAETKKK